MKRAVLSLAIAIAFVGVVDSADAQRPARARREINGTGGILEEAGNALGMIRGTGRTTNKGVILIRYTANGTVQMGRTSYKVDKVVADIAHYMPAARMDWELTDPKGVKSHRIEVVRDKLAWNETTPGLGATAAPGQAATRLRQVWLYPHAAIWAAADAGSKITTAEVGGKTTLTFPSPADGAPMKVTLANDNRPEKVETVENGQPLVMEYSDYKDIEVYGTYFPHHIVQKRGGRVVMDLTVTEGHTNSYAAFPIPDVAKAAAVPK